MTPSKTVSWFAESICTAIHWDTPAMNATAEHKLAATASQKAWEGFFTRATCQSGRRPTLAVRMWMEADSSAQHNARNPPGRINRRIGESRQELAEGAAAKRKKGQRLRRRPKKRRVPRQIDRRTGYRRLSTADAVTCSVLAQWLCVIMEEIGLKARDPIAQGEVGAADEALGTGCKKRRRPNGP